MADSSSSSSSSSQPPSPKRRKIHSRLPTHSVPPIWRTDLHQHIYTSKLVQTLRRLRPHSTSRAVRAAADRVLAVSARGKTRWSRSILAARLNKNKHRKAAVKLTAAPGIKKPPVHKKPPPPPIILKVKALSRLVPGCRKLSLPNLLEETTDYVAALEMQVRAMAFLTGLLNGEAAGSAPSANQHQYFNPS